MRQIILTLSLPLFLLSCGGETIDVKSNPIAQDEITNIDETLILSEAAMSSTIGGKIFSLPSPVQMSMLLKEEVGMFDSEMISDPTLISKYSTTHKKALNMGVYGADLGYATIFENSTVAVSYLATIEKLADELSISGAFDEVLINRFIENGNHQDSMLVIMADGYRAGDKFLKDNKQHDVATLILTGGWIESLYFATISYPYENSQKVANRIGEQKSALINIIDLLMIYNTEGYYSELIKELGSLKLDFDLIEYSYEYIQPETNSGKGLTEIKSKTSVIIKEATMQSIIAKVKEIRENIIS
jgi:hypothetical protein